MEYTSKKSQPLCVHFDGAEDKDGDGYIEIRSGVAAQFEDPADAVERDLCIPRGDED